MRRHATALLLAAVGIVHAPSVRAAGAPAAAMPTRIMLFNLTPAGSYQVRRNGVPGGESVASPAGGVVYQASASSGDRYEFILTGLDPVSPARPAGFTAAGSHDGCVTASWTPPSAADYVTGYSLVWGASAGAYTDSVLIDALDITRGSAWIATRCGFPNGTYAFALRAHNAFDRWSPLSSPSTATISNEDTQGPLPPTNPEVTESSPGCAAVSWTKSSDASVSGYRVFFGTRPRSLSDYTDSFDAGSAASAAHCGLAAGTYYFAVRAYTGGGVMSAYSREVMLSARGTDVAAPVIANRTPAAGATDVPVNTTIYFTATDDKTGIDASSIAVTVEGSARTVVTAPSPGGLAVQCTGTGDLPPGSDIDVSLTVADRSSPPNITTRTYTFRTGTATVDDGAAPVLGAVAPPDGGESADMRPTIDVRVRDAGPGIDLSSLAMEVNGDAVAFAFDGTPADARIRYRPAAAFAPGDAVDVHVEACDRGGRCATLDYRFTVGTATAAGSRGLIVPDGYWARDTARPLEVRDLPQSWCVRIFDVAGGLVRRHQNATEGATWTWNFRNDGGSRVAPALYLVRVTDAKGSVQRSGRFLVQSAP